MTRHTLICTVGTSLFGNIRAPYRENLGIPEAMQRELQDLLKQGDMSRLAQKLTKIDPKAFLCGAEITSIEDTMKKKWLNLRHLHFLVSDTDEGRQMGKFLESYYTERSDELSLQTVEYHIVEKLQDQEPKQFKVHGLRNLVRQAGKLVQRYSAEKIAINATGGYKAQIAVAVILGQALGIPVLYRHERFSEIIDFPPMPISFDYQILGENADLLADLEAGEAFTLTEIDHLGEKIRVFLDEIDVDGEPMFELGAVGEIFLTGFRLRLSRQINLQKVAQSEKSVPSFRDDHHPKGFEEFVKRICKEIAWVRTAHSLLYDKQKSIKGIGFYVREGKLIGTYQDKDNFGARFELLSTAQSQDELAWAADQLNQQYKKGS